MKLALILTAIGAASALPLEGRRRLQFNETYIADVTEEEKLAYALSGKSFFDITGLKQTQQLHGVSGLARSSSAAPGRQYEYPANLTHVSEVNSIIGGIDTKYMYDKLDKFSSFFTRYYTSPTGAQSARWLFDTLKTATAPISGKVILRQFKHDWDQFSIIVSIPGSARPDKIVAFGAHQDSIAGPDPATTRSPGADDDGSGVITNLEALRLYAKYIADTGKWPENTIEFHFYSAEEVGLLGSLQIMTEYHDDPKKNVVAFFQHDMTGYVKNAADAHIGVIVDYTDHNLTTFMEKLIGQYLTIPGRVTKCGYACSDHASATKQGFPSAFAFESVFEDSSEFIHSPQDTIDRVNITHMAEFSKLAIGAVVELSDWVA
ncbi:AAR129Cp [Eremothecium gossypii ATCC 10895]|uniref:Peptide hydrolase n=1 Tax=Eremothecium gossypii (strain ATCC 10895 / CBS 109.51 / FGSC 9923 / NRRL Y-1056) TaxID=284811 RepID=Q75EF2_EREGS|nr:AAR129Cp [Eremothecium gossypii ATCC 10895]AAS50495.1 AAR129Cp [Eremothecium gossypii ATCC 10895]AEY94782.1 FAAR129Cp [Eremothecium gossypii FDAG1]